LVELALVFQVDRTMRALGKHQVL